MALDFHEPPEQLSKEAREWHRAICSLIEEFEAIDWYYQRADVTEDEELKRILLHNMNEEAEHAAMSLEWIRRRYPKLSEKLKSYLFTEGSIAGKEKNHEEAAPHSESAPKNDLGIGAMRKGEKE